MQYLNKVNETCGPYYDHATQVAKQHYQGGVQTLSQITKESTDKINKVVSQGEEFKKQAWEIADQTADEILEYVEEKLKLGEEEKSVTLKRMRVVRIYNKVKDTYLTVPFSQLYELGLTSVERLTPAQFRPVLARVQATLMVGQELIAEMILNRLGDIKATVVEEAEHYIVKAKTLAGAIKLQERIQHYQGELRGFVLRNRDRGVELWVKKEELFHNFYASMEALAEQAKATACENYTAGKQQATQLYEQVLRRIKEKEIQITTQWATAAPALTTPEAAGEMIPAEIKAAPEAEAEE